MTDEERRRRAAARRRAEKKKKEARMIRILTVVVAALIVAVIVIVAVSCSHKKEAPKGSSNQEVSTEEASTEAARSEIELIAVGDVLMHTPLLNYADQGDGTYDFNHIFSVMKDDISKADIAVCNQETPIDTTIPADGGIQFIFNTPGAIGDAEINAGFDIIQQASNHSYDEGSDGILHTIDYWKTKEGQAVMIGMNESQEKRDTITYYEKNGIKFALINYTYGLNGFELVFVNLTDGFGVFGQQEDTTCVNAFLFAVQIAGFFALMNGTGYFLDITGDHRQQCIVACIFFDFAQDLYCFLEDFFVENTIPKSLA